MEPGSPEWIEKTVEELEYLENARESLASATLGSRTLPNELAREVQLAAFDQRIAALFSQLEPYAGDEEETLAVDSLDAAPALSTGLPVAKSSQTPQPVIPESNALDSDPFSAPAMPAPASLDGDVDSDLFDDTPQVTDFSEPGSAFSGSDTGSGFGSGLSDDYGDDFEGGGSSKKRWLIPAALGAVAVAAGFVALPMLSGDDAPQSDPTLSQPAAAAIAPAATPAPTPVVPEPEPEPEPVKAPEPEPEPEPEPVKEEVKEDAPDGIDPAILKEKSPRGRRARRKARMLKKREARKARREAALAKKRAARKGKGDGEGKKKRPKKKKSSSSGDSSKSNSGAKKRRRLDLDNSGDPLG